MAVTLRGSGSGSANTASQNVNFPSGTVAGDTAYLFIAGVWGCNDPSGWNVVAGGTSGGGSPLLGSCYSRVLDAGDISTGYVTFTSSSSGAVTWAIATFIGSLVAARIPTVFDGGGISAGGDRNINSDAGVLTGDYCLLFGGIRNWSDETFTAPAGCSQLQQHPDAVGASGCLYNYTAIADGVFVATHHSLWGNNSNNYIVALYEDLPPGAVGVEASEARVFSISGGISTSLRLSEARALVVYNIPTEFEQVSQVSLKVVASSTVDVQVSGVRIYAIIGGRTVSHTVRCGAFSLDGHDLYVLHLGDAETLVYDLTTGQWADWNSPDLLHWRANCFQTWIGMGTTAFADGAQSKIVAGDDNAGQLWTVEPEQPYDDSIHIDRDPLLFTRKVIGGVPMKMRQTQKVGAVYLTLGNLGNVVGATCSLRTSDTDGKTWQDHGTITIDPGNYDQEFAWRSLGLIRAPGRIFEITDNGISARLNGMDMR